MLSNRPAKVKKEVPMEFDREELTPFQRRKERQFSGYFNELWKELNEDNEKKE